METRCIATSGALAALALQSPEHDHLFAELPRSVQRAIDEVGATLSADTQLAQLGPLVDKGNSYTMPRLLTQPEWQSLAPPGARRSPGSTADDAASPAPGSLEELVIESVIEDVIATLTEIGHDLEGLHAPMTFVRGDAATSFSSRTRALVWRTARIDWTLTLIDSRRADCWHTRTSNGSTHTRIPWTVALAIRTRKALGFMSAIRDG